MKLLKAEKEKLTTLKNSQYEAYRNLRQEGVKFSVSMGKILFDKKQICIIVLSEFLLYCYRITYLFIVLPF